MLSPDRVVKDGLEFALSILNAQSVTPVEAEELFRALFTGYPTTEVDALWAHWSSGTRRPTVQLGFARNRVEVPQFQVTLASSSEDYEIAANIRRLDKANQRYELSAGYKESVRVSILAPSPSDLQWLYILARACLRIAHTYILTQEGIEDFGFQGARDLEPLPNPGTKPELIFVRQMFWRISTCEALWTSTPVLDPDFIKAVTATIEGHAANTVAGLLTGVEKP